MKIAVVVLNDIHFDAGGPNPVLAQADFIAGAVFGENVQLDGLVVILAGDVANNGVPNDYLLATTFLEKLREGFRKRFSDLRIDILGVPGNHDCELPEDGIEHRRSQVESSIKTFLEEAPDRVFVNHLLQPQQAYWSFAEQTGYASPGEYSKLCSVKRLPFGSKLIQFNLYNSAGMSQRHEDQRHLVVPVKLFEKTIPPAPDETITISVIHHPLQWMEPSNMLELRHFLAQTSDIIITGHQHNSATFTQAHESGERVLYLENPPLYDRSERVASAFRVLTFELEGLSFKHGIFEWRESLFRPNDSLHEWRSLELNRGIRHKVSLESEFLSEISDPGVVYLHPDRPRIALQDLFVFPDLKPTGNGSTQRAVRGADVASHLAKSGIYLVKGEAFSGKTALAKSLFSKYFATNEKLPILLNSAKMTASTVEIFEMRLMAAVRTQYVGLDIDAYKQLPTSERIVILDNWHLAKLTAEQRLMIYKWLRSFASATILFTDKLYELKQIVTNAAVVETVLSTEESMVSQYEIIGLSHVGRGELINRWLNLRKDSAFDPPQESKESKGTEDIISKLLGKDSLPPYAFFIICLLQAKENRSIDYIAGGSFGHLYEVLVTSALYTENSDQLDRKYAFLSEIAAFMWRNEITSISLEEVGVVAATYLANYSIPLRVESLLKTMEEARVLRRVESTYSFTYNHFYYYFVARFIRDRIDDEEDGKLLDSIDYMIDYISSEMNSAVIMFLIYFAKEKRRIIDRLVANATKIYSEVLPANLDKDAAPFMHRREAPEPLAISANEDVAKGRMQERQELDSEQNLDWQTDEVTLPYAYVDGLRDIQKMHLADRNIDALGQVIRNFSANLPVKTKTEVLRCAYLLGLRTMGRIMSLLAFVMDEAGHLFEESRNLDIGDDKERDIVEVRRELEMVKLVTGKMVAIVYLRKISSSVGVLDMEDAYRRAFVAVEKTTAIDLLAVTIEMDHFRSFPEEKIKKLYRRLGPNPFAQGILQWLVASYLLVYRVELQTRQRMANLLGANESKLIKLSLNQEGASSRQLR